MTSLETALREAFLSRQDQRSGAFSCDVWTTTDRGARVHIPAGSYIHFCNDASIMNHKAEKRAWNFADVFVGVKEGTYLECIGFTLRIRPNGSKACKVSMGTSPGGQKVILHRNGGSSLQTVRAALVIK